MTAKLARVKLGVRRALEGIPGLRVIDYTPDTWNDFPLAVVAFGRLRVNATLAGAYVTGEVVVTLMTSGANPQEALTDLDPLIESVDAALRADSGAAHYIALDWMDDIGVRNMGSQRHGAADLHIRFMAG